MASSGSFVQRVVSFAPFQRKNGSVLDDESSRLDENEFLDTRSTLLAHTEKESDVWGLNLARLRDHRIRPFTGAAVMSVLVSLFVTVVASMLSYAYYRQLVIADEEQDFVGHFGAIVAGSVALFALLNAFCVYSFAATGGWTASVRFLDFVQKVSFVAVLAVIAVTLRFWDNEPAMDAEPSVWSYLTYPMRSFVLVLSCVAAVALVAGSLLSTALPYRPSAAISASSLRTIAILTFAAGLAACGVGMSTIVAAPTTYFEDLYLWFTMGTGLAAALLAVGLVGTIHAARSASDMGNAWGFTLVALTAAVGTSSALLYVEAVPELSLPLTVSNTLFATAVLGLLTAALLVFALAHWATWKLAAYTSVDSEAAYARKFVDV